MINPANRSKWLSVGLLALVLVLAACVRPVPTDPTPTTVAEAATLPPQIPTAAPEVIPTTPPEIQPTAVPEVQPTPVPTAPPDGGGGGQGETVHVVAPGDTLYNISRRYSVPVADIMAANSLVNPNYIVVGQQLIIPAPGSVPPPGGGDPGKVHTVRPGENLFRIGLAYGCTVDQMAQANGIAYPYTIYPGQQLTVPAC